MDLRVISFLAWILIAGSAVLADCDDIICESTNYQPNTCLVDGIIQNVTISKQISKSTCLANDSFSYVGNKLHVSGGCRAKFEVCFDIDTDTPTTMSYSNTEANQNTTETANTAYVPEGYIGCFIDSGNRALNGKRRQFYPNSGTICKSFCRAYGYRYAGTEGREECFCGNEIRLKRPAYNCDYECESNPSEFCGGYWRISIYDTWYCATEPCLNGATCKDKDADHYSCICTEKWTGIHCEKPQTTVQTSSSSSTTTTTTSTSTTTSIAVTTKTSTTPGESTEGTSRASKTNVTDIPYINPTDSANNGMIAVYVLIPVIVITLAILLAVFISRKSPLKCMNTSADEKSLNQNSSTYYENQKYNTQLGTERSLQSDNENEGTRDGQRIKLESSGVAYYNTVDNIKGFECSYENVINSEIGNVSQNQTGVQCESKYNNASFQCYESLRKETQGKDNSYDCLNIQH
ncbi:uncharacterized protein LOC123551714 isoform X2 [Mercenaria mercenaria]|uniref:uncharacterized protein LOC123551714 isoform X2 n=1 Tax=Mercenaria mercenaria TaxID=6596 RepID=UPI00234F3A12|nr:uncharacterized protein LOC123551714 isoform X2 [Mercenaria mercenaria]